MKNLRAAYILEMLAAV